ncbi:cytochrome P450 monooxygenase-like protein [Ilyonectria sp. MPI-CAGE-AT-0026]|nr:cytochrome P450 monooxygenase-like protein [Ilyonectria sp. MPI-CAGE-AT-0026]
MMDKIPTNLSTAQKLGAVSVSSIGLLTAYICFYVVYNYYFHPLAKYPGPKLAAVSQLWHAKHWMGGRWAYDLLDLSKKYGDVIRIAPNELLFTTVEAFEDLYGHANNKRGRKVFLKSEFYDNPDEMSPLGAERDAVRHSETRKLLAHSFSETALSEQVAMIQEHINLFMKQVGKYGHQKEGIDVDEWFNWLTFDIIGDLAFGESFHAVETAKTNPQITMLVNILYTGSLFSIFRRMPYLLPLAPFMLPISKLKKEREEHIEFSRTLMRKRIEKGNNRADFFGHLLTSNEKQPSEEFLRTNASSLLIAGSETTATTLAGVTYFVLERPECLRALQQEVRTAFKSIEEIDHISTRDLPYLGAVVKEGLRIFIPLPINVPRVSPGAVVDGNYIPKGTIVSGHQFTLGHSSRYFADPEGFHPERWLPTDHSLYNTRYVNDTLKASQPFLIGPRTCLGKNLAYMEMRIILAKLVFLFNWEAMQSLGPGLEVDWARDCKTQFLWAKPRFNVRYVPRV